jgi:hypothetical protein
MQIPAGLFSTVHAKMIGQQFTLEPTEGVPA